MTEKYISGYQDGNVHYNFVDKDAQEKIDKINNRVRKDTAAVIETANKIIRNVQPLNVGSENAGKILGVDSEGNLVPIENNSSLQIEVDF